MIDVERSVTTKQEQPFVDLFGMFNVDYHALHYFGILCFTDMPGYFPQLEMPAPPRQLR